jgi:iron(III) transport system substrate-binding protein
VVKASDQPAEAQQLVKYLTSEEGQKLVAGSTALEYSLSPTVATNPQLKPLSELEPPKINIAELNGPKVVELMTEAGLL